MSEKKVTFNLTPTIHIIPSLTEEEKANLVGICDSKIKEFSLRQKKVGSSHTGWGLKRYKAIKQAKGKCELCGIPKELRSLDADHIVPKTDADKNGKVEIEGELVDVDDQKNIQSFCARPVSDDF